jgi:hypothetical protein
LHVVERNTFKKSKIKKWGSKLTWDDFKGATPLNISYAAGVSSSVFFELDSATHQFHAYAGQDNLRSCVKERSDYVLNHEQYHFNITEIFARRFNEIIREHPTKPAGYFKTKLDSIGKCIEKMQDDYDQESSHGSILGWQYRWEYKIDSLLQLNSPDSGWINDRFSGFRIYFPVKPAVRSVVSQNSVYTMYEMQKRDLYFSLNVHQQTSLAKNLDEFRSGVQNFSRKPGERIISVSCDSLSGYRCRIIKVLGESKGEIIFQQINNRFYELTTSYRLTASDTVIFSNIANSFLRSFSITNTEKYWLTRSETSDLLEPFHVDSKLNHFSCMLDGAPGKQGFSAGPFIREDGSVLFAYKIVAYPDSLIASNKIRIGKQLYDSKPTGANHLYLIPPNMVPKGDFKVDVGYTLKNDSVGVCSHFHYETIDLK